MLRIVVPPNAALPANANERPRIRDPSESDTTFIPFKPIRARLRAETCPSPAIAGAAVKAIRHAKEMKRLMARASLQVGESTQTQEPGWFREGVCLHPFEWCRFIELRSECARCRSAAQVSEE